MGIRTSSDESVTSATLLPAVHVSPENWKVVRPRGSQRGSRPHMTPGTRDVLVLVTNIGPSTGEGTAPCPAQTPPPNPIAAVKPPNLVRDGFCQGRLRVYMNHAA